jgi:mannose-6-phosphate isomerase-like protein (cupin superfamily)
MGSVIRQKGEGKAYWFLGELYDIRVSGKDTGGKYCLIELTVPPGLPLGAPPHIHHDADETVYVLEGSGRYHVGDQTVDVSTGAVLHFPRGTLEWFENTGKSPLKVAVMYSPAGIEKFFAEVAEPAATRTVPPPPEGPPDLERLVAVAKKYKLEIQPPPGR